MQRVGEVEMKVEERDVRRRRDLRDRVKDVDERLVQFVLGVTREIGRIADEELALLGSFGEESCLECVVVVGFG